MKPRMAAEEMVQAMKEAARQKWAELEPQLEVKDKKAGKQWVWEYVKGAFGR